MTAVFHTRDPGWQSLPQVAKAFRQAHGAAFGSNQAANQYLRNIVTPVCGSWAFCPNGKTGTTSTLYMLFHLMFGIPLTVRNSGENQMHADGSTVHSLTTNRVFAGLAARGDAKEPLDVLDQALRLTTVRHPFDRAVSGFLYVGRAHSLNSERFLDIRQRMSAMVGFDWDTHAGTVDGFVRFLSYIEHALAHHDTLPVDSHLRPQHLNILPVVFRPDLIGRCEDLPSFFVSIAARLGRPLPEGLDLTVHKNRSAIGATEDLSTPQTRARAEALFATDYEMFGY